LPEAGKWFTVPALLNSACQALSRLIGGCQITDHQN